MSDTFTQYIAGIVIKIAEIRNIEVDKLMTQKKSHDVCITRYMIYNYLHSELCVSANKIGKYFNSTRRSVLRGIQTLKDWMVYHSSIKNEYNEIIKQLKGGD